jgi:hypothetical protein
MIYAASSYMDELTGVFSKRVISRVLWPPHSPGLSLCDLCLWGTLTDIVYLNNPHSLKELEENI